MRSAAFSSILGFFTAVTICVTAHAQNPAPAPAPAPAAAPAPPAATPQPSSPADYGSRLDALNKRLQGIKTRLQAAGARIQALRDYMVKNVNPNARLIVRFDDRMGSDFEPLSVIVSLDGKQLASWTKAQRTVRSGGQHPVLNIEVPVGPKVLNVRASYKGAGGMPYMKDYAFKLNRTHKFMAKGGRITTVIAYGYQRGDATYDPSQRPWIGFDTSDVEYTQRNLKKVAPPEPEKKQPAPAPKKPGKGAPTTAAKDAAP